MNRDQIIDAILSCLRAICKVKGIPEAQPFGESTLLIGSEAAILDSLAFVMFLVQLEESLNASSGTPTALIQRLLADDSGTETVGTLADRALALLGGRP